MRIGIGFDIHRLVVGRRFVLGGIEIEFDRGPAGHSDGDPLLHAVTDGLFGAAALGDIGEHFPDDDPTYRDADSAELLAEAVRRVRAAGYQIVNIDANVFVQAPTLGPHKDAMRKRIAALTGLEPASVNVKAKTTEGLGEIGRGDAIAAQAVVLLEERA